MKTHYLAMINWARKCYDPFARFALFVIYFWFGILKVVGYSPASGLVKDLLAHTIPFMAPDTFVMALGVFEVLVGVLFLIKGLEMLAIPLLAIHLVTVFMPLVLLPSVAWSQFLVPTLEGQYMIKNLLIISAAIGIIANLKPVERK